MDFRFIQTVENQPCSNFYIYPNSSEKSIIRQDIAPHLVNATSATVLSVDNKNCDVLDNFLGYMSGFLVLRGPDRALAADKEVIE